MAGKDRGEWSESVGEHRGALSGVDGRTSISGGDVVPVR
jgi:hypothetical protein